MRYIRLIIAKAREAVREAREIDKFARAMERLSDDAQALGWACVATLDAMIEAEKRGE